MVAKKIPYPILKYLELSSDELEKVQEKYPFYLFPKIARTLETVKSSEANLNDLNYFGFHQKKLETYSEIYNKTDIITLGRDEDIDDSIIEDESEDLHEIDIQIDEIDDFKTSPIDLNIEESEKENEIQVDTKSEAEPQLVDSENDGNSTDDEFSIDLTNIDTETDINDLSADTDILFDIEDKTTNTLDSNTENTDLSNKDSFSIELSENHIDLDLKNMLDSIDFQFEDESDEKLEINSLATSDDLSSIELKEINTPKEQDKAFEVPEISNSLNLEKELEKLDIDFNFSDNVESSEEVHSNEDNNSIEKLEPISDTANIADIKDEDKAIPNMELETADEINPISIEAKEKIEIQEESSVVESETNDFSSWLNMFNNNSKPILPNEGNVENASSDENLEMVHNNKPENSGNLVSDLGNLSQDEELEGVLKDNFFKAQVEHKKTSRKTPVENRLQDEAQNSLDSIDIVSETMAILYVQQENIPKAIDIYKKLIDEFPQKSSFFASQIEKLSK